MKNANKSFEKPKVIVSDIKTAKSKPVVAPPVTSATKQTANRPRVTMGDRKKLANFNKIMSEITPQLSTSQQILGIIMHNPKIEMVSDKLAATIFRPLPLLYGSFGAAFASILTYALAKKYGYTVAGSELYIGFIAGWMLGLFVDYSKKLFIKK